MMDYSVGALEANVWQFGKIQKARFLLHTCYNFIESQIMTVM
jgi:hypothetical protein